MNKIISMIKDAWSTVTTVTTAFVIAPTVITLAFKGYGSFFKFAHNLTFAFTVTTAAILICWYLNTLEMRQLERATERPTCSRCNKKTGVYWECDGGKVIICCDCAMSPPNNNAND